MLSVSKMLPVKRTLFFCFRITFYFMLIVFYLIFHLLFVFVSSCLVFDKISVHFCGFLFLYLLCFVDKFYFRFLFLAFFPSKFVFCYGLHYLHDFSVTFVPECHGFMSGRKYLTAFCIIYNFYLFN